MISATILQPAGLRRSRPPLIIVSGAPASGKTTWVRENASPDDVVIDLDVIAQEVSGARGCRLPDQDRWLEAALLERNRRLAELAGSDAPAAWFIVGAPTGGERQRWASMLGACRVVVMMTPHKEALERVNKDRDRDYVRPQHRQAVLKWWLDYTPRVGDELVGGG